ncbi:MAG: hypothetical protein ABGY42_00860 [bacterium]
MVRRNNFIAFRVAMAMAAAMVLSHPVVGSAGGLLTSADGNGADGYAPIFAGSPFDAVDIIKVKFDRGSGGVQNKGYLRFDLSGVTGSVTAAELLLEIAVDPEADAAPGETVGVDSYEVYGLNDGHSGESWIEVPVTGITWALAPGNDVASNNGVLAAETTLLGTFDLVSGVHSIGDPFAWTSAALVSFLDADTNDLVTLILIRTDKSFPPGGFATKEHATGAPPTLDITTTCGNGLPDALEQCDDGNDNGTSRSCCSKECTFKPDGPASCDANLCTTTDTCTAGVCTAGPCREGQACSGCGGQCSTAATGCSCVY